MNTLDPADPWGRLTYTLPDTGETVDCPIRRTVTFPPFGGVRWWLACPMSVDGRSCQRRVGKLYLRGGFFGCRHCHGLTYSSCQRSREYHTVFRHLAREMGCDPATVKRASQSLARLRD